MTVTYRAEVDVETVLGLLEQPEEERAAENAGYDPLAPVPEPYREEERLEAIATRKAPPREWTVGDTVMHRERYPRTVYEEGDTVLQRHDIPLRQFDHRAEDDAECMTIYRVGELERTTEVIGHGERTHPLKPAFLPESQSRYAEIIASLQD